MGHFLILDLTNEDFLDSLQGVVEFLFPQNQSAFISSQTSGIAHIIVRYAARNLTSPITSTKKFDRTRADSCRVAIRVFAYEFGDFYISIDKTTLPRKRGEDLGVRWKLDNQTC
jgi:hypothetical protein